MWLGEETLVSELKRSIPKRYLGNAAKMQHFKVVKMSSKDFLSCGHDSGTSLEVKSQANDRVALLSYAMPSLGNLCEGERERKKWVRISAK